MGSTTSVLCERAELGGEKSPSKFTPPLPLPPICSSIRPNAIYSQIHPDDDNALAVLIYAVGLIPCIEYIAFLSPSSLLSYPAIVVVVGHTNRRGGSGDRNELAASTSRAYTPTQAYAARRALRRLAGGHAHPEILMRLIEERVSVQVNDFANLESVCKARAVGRNNLKVHRLLYELETSRPRDPKIRSSRGLEYEKGDKKNKMTDLHESR